MVFFGLCAATLGVGMGVAGAELFRPPSPVSATTTVVRAGPPVVVAVQELARLETAQFHMERVIDLRDQQLLMGLVEAEDAILLVAAARVSAGVDLRSVAGDDMEIDRDHKAVTIHLPPPEIFEASLDNERTYVHTRDTDLLAERAETLETRARREAERNLRQAALEAGILDVAKTNAERTVRTLLQSLDFVEVTIEFDGSAPGGS